MFMSEEELAVKVTKIDRIQVDYVDFAEAGQGKVLE